MSVVDSETPLVEDVSEPSPQNKQIDLNKDLTSGYVVGLTTEGSFLFQVLGVNPGLAELMGLQKHAEEHLRQLYGTKQMTAEAVTLQMLNNVTNQLVAVSEQLTMLQEANKSSCQDSCCKEDPAQVPPPEPKLEEEA